MTYLTWYFAVWPQDLRISWMCSLKSILRCQAESPVKTWRANLCVKRLLLLPKYMLDRLWEIFNCPGHLVALSVLLSQTSIYDYVFQPYRMISPTNEIAAQAINFFWACFIRPKEFCTQCFPADFSLSYINLSDNKDKALLIWSLTR